MMDCCKVSPISPPMQLGEGPHWLERDQSLIFVDYPGGTLNRIYTSTGRHQILEIEGAGNGIGPSVIIPVEGTDDRFLVGLGHDLVCVQWTTSDPDILRVKPRPILCFDEQHPKNGLNDAKCDPQGRLWAGTKGHEDPPGHIEPNKGTLFMIDQDLEVKEKVKEVTISNGLTWSLDSGIFYYIDTVKLTVDAFDYNDVTGDIGNRRVVFDFKENDLKDHYPDGMTIDNDGNLWVACYNGAKVINIDPKTGKLIRKVDIPSRYTTSCCFGGLDFSTLFVTSATRSLSKKDLLLCPDSGKTFAVTGLGVKGTKHHNFKVNLDVLKQKL